MAEILAYVIVCFAKKIKEFAFKIKIENTKGSKITHKIQYQISTIRK